MTFSLKGYIIQRVLVLSHTQTFKTHNKMETLKNLLRNPSNLKRRFWSALVLMVILVLGYFITIWYLIPVFKEIKNIEPKEITICHIGVPIVIYLLITSATIFFVRTTKNGKLESLERCNIITAALLGLVVGCLVFVFVFFFRGIFVISFDGGIVGLSRCIFESLSVGLYLGYLIGLYTGVCGVFSD